MAGWEVALAVAFVWILGGLAGYYYLWRHGYPHKVWIIWALLLGPLAIVIFSERVEASTRVVHERSDSGPSDLTVVVGLDGSAESLQALQEAQHFVGSQAGQFVLCEVVDHDAEVDPAGTGVAEAIGRLERAAATLPAGSATVKVVAGTPAQALAAVAEEHDADILVVGQRGQGVSKRLLGSVAEGLPTKSSCPVLISHGRSTE